MTSGNPGFNNPYVKAVGVLTAFIAAAILLGDSLPGGEYAAVLLDEPINMSFMNDSTINFTYYPQVVNGSFHHSELWVYNYSDTTWYNVANNTTAIVNNSKNWIEYTFT
jgi:hypothetical protein